jgi:hypothetical protein
MSLQFSILALTPNPQQGLNFVRFSVYFSHSGKIILAHWVLTLLIRQVRSEKVTEAKERWQSSFIKLLLQRVSFKSIHVTRTKWCTLFTEWAPKEVSHKRMMEEWDPCHSPNCTKDKERCLYQNILIKFHHLKHTSRRHCYGFTRTANTLM